MTIQNSKLENNYGMLLSMQNTGNHKALLYFCENVSVSYITSTHSTSLMFIGNVDVIFNGTVIISENTVNSASIIMFRVFFYNTVEFSSNTCTDIIGLQNQYLYMIVAEYANIKFDNNLFEQPFSVFDDTINPLCLFQYMSAENTKKKFLLLAILVLILLETVIYKIVLFSIITHLTVDGYLL